MSEQKKCQVVKRPYVSPVIEVYGNIRAITQAVGQKGNPDGATASPNKTSLV